MKEVVETVTMVYFDPLETLLIFLALAVLGLLLTFPFYAPPRDELN